MSLLLPKAALFQQNGAAFDLQKTASGATERRSPEKQHLPA